MSTAGPDRIAQIVDDVLSIVDSERGRLGGMVYNKDTPNFSRLRHLDVSHMLVENEDDFIFGLTDTTPDVIWPISVGLAMKTSDGDWHFVNARTVTGKDVRGKVRMITPKMMAIQTITLLPNGKSGSATEYFAWAGSKWVDADTKQVTRHHDSVRNMMPDVDHYAGKGAMILSAALRHRYEWSISIRRPDSPSFRFATDAIGVRALLSERDKGESGRREALRSWVTDHWRQSRVDPDEEVYVRKHLRGGEEFLWRGYLCEWRPSQYDQERNRAFALERKMMGRQAVRKGRAEPAAPSSVVNVK